MGYYPIQTAGQSGRKDTDMNPTTPTQDRKLYLGIELSNKHWKVAFGDGQAFRYIQVCAGDLPGLKGAIAQARQKFGLPETSPVLSCYEAGRDGFWIHRALLKIGVENLVVDPASIEINRRKRQLKTDRIDAHKLVRQLMRFDGGETTVWRVVVVPDEKSEGARRTSRERDRLVKEQSGHLARIKSLLVLHGIRPKRMGKMDAGLLTDWEGKALAPELRAEIQREQERLKLLRTQIQELEKLERARMKSPESPLGKKVAKLARLKSIGVVSATILVEECLGWRTFQNRRQVGAFVGLTATAFASGDSNTEQGISKAGNKRLRATLVELAWMWVRFQPDSAISQWFQQRLLGGSKRIKRVSIVAVARKLMIALWRYVEFDEVPAGAVFSPA
jgi:transposase